MKKPEYQQRLKKNELDPRYKRQSNYLADIGFGKEQGHLSPLQQRSLSPQQQQQQQSQTQATQPRTFAQRIAPNVSTTNRFQNTAAGSPPNIPTQSLSPLKAGGKKNVGPPIYVIPIRKFNPNEYNDKQNQCAAKLQLFWRSSYRRRNFMKMIRNGMRRKQFLEQHRLSTMRIKRKEQELKAMYSMLDKEGGKFEMCVLIVCH